MCTIPVRARHRPRSVHEAKLHGTTPGGALTPVYPLPDLHVYERRRRTDGCSPGRDGASPQAIDTFHPPHTWIVWPAT